MNLSSFPKKSLSFGSIVLFSVGVLLTSCNGCSKHGSCPAYTYKAKKEASAAAHSIKTIGNGG